MKKDAVNLRRPRRLLALSLIARGKAAAARAVIAHGLALTPRA